jgi:sugar-specific transcriptional regulator TrmB
MMVIENMQELGLSKREESCYCVLLEIGETTVGALINKTKIPSSKIYEVLDRLIEKGLVSFVIKSGRKNYQAKSPQIFLQQLDEKKKKLEVLVPKLMSIQNTSAQSVEMFVGAKAILTMFTNIIADVKKGEDYLIFALGEEKKSESENIILRTLTLRRKDKNLNVMMLKNKKYKNNELHTKIKIKYVDFDFPQGITVFRDKVIFLSWSNPEAPLAVVITSEEFSGEFKKFFGSIWKNKN